MTTEETPATTNCLCFIGLRKAILLEGEPYETTWITDFDGAIAKTIDERTSC